MKQVLKFLIFIMYTIIIFFVKDWLYLSFFFLFNIFLLALNKMSLRKAIGNIFSLMPFILFTVAINIFLDNLQNAILIGVRLMLVCNITYIYSKKITVTEFANVIKKICTPLKIFNIDINDIELLVCISLSMIPVLKNEYIQIKEACKAKGINMRLSNNKIILNKVLVSIVKRVKELEMSIKEKGYV